tara:strand:+ start:504 stop:896 length:393 start_codon:yes stop_codon:yes gene_type:complete
MKNKTEQTERKRVLEKTERNKKRTLKAIEKVGWNVTAICKMAKIGRTQYYYWLNNDPEFKEAVADARQATYDLIKSKYLEKIEEGNITAIIHGMECLGKDEGWVKRQEIAGVQDQPINIEVDITPPSNEA